MPVLDVLHQPTYRVRPANLRVNVERVPQQQVRGLPEHYPVNDR
jgi:hypothetical protein